METSPTDPPKIMDNIPNCNLKLSKKQELKRYHRQYICEALSLIIMLIAVFFLIATPFLLLPIWAFPQFNSQLTRALLWLSLLLSIVFTVIAAFIGNIYWYYDADSRKLKWRLHCGNGPQHIWGSTLFQFNANSKANMDQNSISIAV